MNALKLHERPLKVSQAEQQRMIATATGNYKRGNEKL